MKTSGGISNLIFLSVRAVFQQLEKTTTSVILLLPVSFFPKAANYSFVPSVAVFSSCQSVFFTLKTKFGRRDGLLLVLQL